MNRLFADCIPIFNDNLVACGAHQSLHTDSTPTSGAENIYAPKPFDSETGTPLHPNKNGSYQLYGGETDDLPSQLTSTFTGSRKGLKPGHYILKAYLSSSYATCNVYERNMNILVNMR